MMRRLLVAVGLLLLTPVALAQLPAWELVDIEPAAARWSMSMAYDSDREVVVMFGGRSVIPPNAPVADTWEFDGTVWTQVFTSNAPAARFWQAMAYDSNRQRVVLFGGGDRDTGTLYAETWEYDGTDWQQVITAHAPPARDQHSMAFDTRRNRVVLFGGSGPYSELNDTWEYDGTDWTQVVTTTSPPRGTLAAMAYDSVRDQVVLFGSGVVFEPDPSDAATWEYDGTEWTLVTTPTSPLGRWAHAMAFDSARQRIVLFGGYGESIPSGSQLDDTWEYDGLDWTEVTTAEVPGAREQHGMAFDWARKRVVLFGGVGWTPGGDTWEYEDELAPLEQLDNLLRLIDYSVDNGSLEGDGPGASANGRLNALINQIENAGALLDSGLTGAACDQLLDALRRTDGEVPPPDFVTGSAASELELYIQDLRTNIGCD